MYKLHSSMHAAHTWLAALLSSFILLIVLIVICHQIPQVLLLCTRFGYNSQNLRKKTTSISATISAAFITIFIYKHCLSLCVVHSGECRAYDYSTAVLTSCKDCSSADTLQARQNSCRTMLLCMMCNNAKVLYGKC